MASVSFSFDPPLRGTLQRVGVLWKLSSDEKKKQWKPRLCAITDHGDLHCFRPADTAHHAADSRVVVNPAKQLRGSFNCREAVVRMLDPAEAQSLGQTHAAFSVQPMDDSHRLVLAASTMQERDEWISTLSQFGDGPSLAPASLPNAKARLLLYGETASASPSASPNSHGAGAGGSMGAAAHAHSSALPSGSHPALVPQLSHPPRSSHAGHKELATLGISLAAYELFKNSEKLYAVLGVGVEGGHTHRAGHAEGSQSHRGERSRSSAMDHGGGSATARGAPANAAAAASSSSAAAAPTPVIAAAPSPAAPALPAAAQLSPATLPSILQLRARLPSPLLHPSESPCLGIALGGARIYWLGWLSKFGGSGTFASWQRRYFILTHAGLMHYWASPELMAAGKPVKGTIDATHSVIRFADEREPGMVPHAFTVQPATPAGARRYALAADTLAEQEIWVAALSHFGDGPVTIPSRAHGAPLLSAKAKDVLFGGNKSESGCAAYDKLGTNRQTLETFAMQPKAFAKLGIFDAQAPPITQRGAAGATAAATLNGDSAAASSSSSASSSPSSSSSAPALCPAVPVMDRFNPHSNLLCPLLTRHAGWLAKRGGSSGTGFRAKAEVKLRYCVLTTEALVYFASNTDAQPKGQISLEGAKPLDASPSLVVGVPTEFEDPFNPSAALASTYPAALTIRHARPQCASEERVFVLYAPSERERDHWIAAIASVIAEQHVKRLQLLGGSEAEGKEAQG